MRQRLNVILLLMSILMLASCTNEAKRALKAEVEEAAATCPINLSEGININDISYDGDNVTYTVVTTSPILSVEALKAHEPLLKPAVLEAIKGTSDKKIHNDIEIIRKAKAGINVVIVEGDETLMLSFAPEDI